MSGKFIVLIMLIAAGLGCWAFFGGGTGSNAAPSPVASKPSPAGAPVPAVQPSATPTANTAPVTSATIGPMAAPADSSDGDGASSFLAMRLDESRIYVALRNDGIDFEKQTKPLTKLGTGPKFGPGPVFQADDDLLKTHHELFQRVQIGEEWELDLSPGSRVHAVVTAPVIVETGCFAGPGFVAQIAATDQLSFAAAGGEYFLLHKPGKASGAVVEPESKAVGDLPDWKATPEFSAALEKLLNERMRQELTKIHEEVSKSGEYDREAARNPKGKPWPKIDDNLTHGEGKIDYDTQAFLLTPDGVPRVYVRARWSIGGKAAFLMSAWVKADAAPSIEAADPSVASLMRMSEMQSEAVDLEKIPKILNVFDPQRDHHAQLVIYSSGYEGFEINLQRYTNSGTVRTRTSIGGGC